MSTWSHLPNAAHIDAVLEDVRARSEEWKKAWEGTWDIVQSVKQIAERDLARAVAEDIIAGHAELDLVWPIALEAVWSAARDTTQHGVWLVAMEALRALIAWPESAALLDLTPDALRTIIDVADGDLKYQAVLLLPAVIARSNV